MESLNGFEQKISDSVINRYSGRQMTEEGKQIQITWAN